MVKCPPCGWSGESYLPAGKPVREYSKCPDCGSKERHRLSYLFLQEIVPSEPYSVLHIAPERVIGDFFRSSCADYLSIDLDIERTNAMKREDLTKLTFSDNSFDFIYCSHVLEHIVDDHTAIRELRRVLSPAGQAVIQVPLFNREITLENNGFDEQMKTLLFGQSDHVRAYGRDFHLRLRKNGFSVEVIEYLKRVSLEEIQEFGLIHDTKGSPVEGQSQELIFLCGKEGEGENEE